MKNDRRKGTYASGPQTRRLIELLDADPELRSGKFSASFTYKIAQRRWCDISKELNAIGGAHKTWSEWRKTYQDKKSRTKKKAVIQKRSARPTDGGHPAEELNDDEMLLLESISSAQLSEQDSKESRVMFEDTSKLNQPTHFNTSLKLKRSLDAALELQRSLQEKINIKKAYYDKKIEQMTRQANALEKIAISIAAKASPYI